MVSIDFTIFIQWLNFGVLVFILYQILYKPLVKFLDERNAKLKDDMDSAKAGREEVERLRREYQEKFIELKTESFRYLDETKKKALEERAGILQAARKEAEKVLAGNRKEMNFEAEKIKQELKKEMSALVINCATQVLEREVKETDHKRLINSFLEEEIKNG
jgi:F-type H+-transporting ATPase subunit b